MAQPVAQAAGASHKNGPRHTIIMAGINTAAKKKINAGSWISDVCGSLRRMPEPDRLRGRLHAGESVLMHFTQSRWLPGTARPIMPKTIYLTGERVIIRTPVYLGIGDILEDYYYSAITNIRLERGVMSASVLLYTRGMTELSKVNQTGMINGLRRHEADKIFAFVQEMIVRTSSDIQRPSAEDVAAAGIRDMYGGVGQGPYG